MNVKPIRTKRDYRAALKEIESLTGAPARTPQREMHFPMDLADAVEAIKFRMEQSGLTAKDLVPMIGQLNRLHRELGIPAESLIKQAEGRQAA
jgi:HTH-type transcriptional regulator/antitoxin HigA